MNYDQLRALALELGFAEIGLCSTLAFDEERQTVEKQLPLAERRQLKYCPEENTPEARSIAVLLWAYPPAQAPSSNRVFIDSYYYASNSAYHAARKLEDHLLRAGVYAKANVSYPARRAAVRAGLGIIGKNSMLITQDFGSRVVIILMATGIELPREQRKPQRLAAPQGCLSCGKCIAACPSGALTSNGLEHPEKCLRNFMMEGIIVPLQVRKQMGARMIGCDTCQRVCPMQPVARPYDEDAFILGDFLSDDPAVFSSAAQALALKIGRNTARPQRIRAQAALLAGNSKNRDYLPALKKLQDSDFDAVRTHAQWAIEQLEDGRN